MYRDLLLRKRSYVNQQLLDKDLNFLSGLPYFSSVAPPSIEYVSSDNVRLTYYVNETNINRFDIGLEELENDEGLAVFSRLSIHNTFLVSDQLLIQGQLGYLSDVNLRSYILRYRQPWLLNRYQYAVDTKVSTVYRSELIRDDDTVYYTIRSGGDILISKPIRRLGVDVGVGIGIESVYPREGSVFDAYQLNSMSVLVMMDTVNNWHNPSAGFKGLVTIEKGGDFSIIDLGGVNFFSCIV